MHLYQLNPTSKRPTVRWMTFNKSKFATVQNCFWSLNSSRATMEKKGYTHPNKVNLYSLNIKEWFWRKRTIKPGDIIFQFQSKTHNFWGLAFKPAICSQSLGISKKGHIYIYISILDLRTFTAPAIGLAWQPDQGSEWTHQFRRDCKGDGFWNLESCSTNM